ncbi:LlaMI family restriction endonuclease [Mycoplasmopsis iners]|uniref:LlaMI family restriction endonuclease n=1 Tax=Mycoplasmopsis iners TaxID=76630 RepID=UPI000496940F|nr:LlaMI family restriction endonuclease [Mycoplasmopsis iners]
MFKSENKEILIEIFNKNIRGKKANVLKINMRHDGKFGHWLEQQFGIKPNSIAGADILGYELKDFNPEVITFGDWSANEYIYTNPEFKHIFSFKTKHENQDLFCMLFGKANKLKNNRYAWSGECCPKINVYNSFGQIMKITKEKDIVVEYSYKEDKRPNMLEIIPKEFQKIENIVLARWYGKKINHPKHKTLEEKIDSKFNQKGWFTCIKNEEGFYEKICFGKPFDFDYWIEQINKNIVYFDSGMHQKNPRPYSQWRGKTKFWNALPAFPTC